MITLTDAKKCTGCASCEQACPAGALKMTQDAEGFLFPVANESLCTNCKKCINICPEENPLESIQPYEVYAVRAKDEEVVNRSSSGGVFGTLAREVINLGGVAFGAGFDKDLNVIHKSAETFDELSELMGSKYVQSDIKNTYKEVKELLKKGVQVLFTGTPCQCAGLKKFLMKDYQNLLLVDFVCHGVPSPALFENYLESMGEKDRIVKVRFRDKTTDKKSGHFISLEYENAPVYRVPTVQDPYMLAFVQNVSLRRSCYNCGFKNFSSGSDITIGDFWGIDKTDSSLRDKEGVSLCALNTEKGKLFFEKISDKADFDLRTLEEALKENKAIVSSTRENPLREKYLKDVSKLSINKLADKYLSNSFSAKLRRFIAKR